MPETVLAVLHKSSKFIFICEVYIIVIHVLKLKKLCPRITEGPILSQQWHQDSNPGLSAVKTAQLTTELQVSLPGWQPEPFGPPQGLHVVLRGSRFCMDDA